MTAWMERPFTDDWTLDPDVFSYKLSWRPDQYLKGCLAKSWDFPSPNTIVFHLREGIHWQNITPANGREFVADDLVFHFNRCYGLGGGFTKPSTFRTGDPLYTELVSIAASDKYTVTMKFKTPNPALILSNLGGAATGSLSIENPDAVQKYGDVNDWHHAIGTGPFILNDYVSSSSISLIKNPDYWGYDERYPQNKLPYVDKLTFLIIPDISTALAALRSGKLDTVDGLSLQQSQPVLKSNPELMQANIPLSNTITVEPRNDIAPFNDIRVRKALQMAIDLPTIAKTYYGGSAEPYPSSLTSRYLTGWGLPYEEWTQSLKDEYAYNPTAAKKLLADAGYPNGFKTNIVAVATNDMDLLQIVKAYFLAVGIDMEIRPMDQTQWTAFVQTGKKYDQMAQRGTGCLGGAGDILRQLNRFQVGYLLNYNMVNDPIFEAFYSKALAATSVDDVKQVVRDANLYVAQQHYAVSLLQPMTFALFQPWLKGFSGQSGSISGPGGSPPFLYCYPARFWIDQNVKKSLGH
jgi:peptide/nickel transport system substrate-binding protein